MNASGLTLLILQFFVFIGCKHEDEMPDDFTFRINWTTSSYDSETGVYRQNYTRGDTSVIAPLSQVELQTVYNLSRKLEFDTFPTEFECEKYGTFTEPHFRTTIEMKTNSKTRRSTNTTRCDRKTQIQNSKNFDNLAYGIHKILESKKEIHNLKSSDIIFL